jgi:hypothetical protein
MKNSQLLNILAALSKKEQRELRKWLISPAHNQRSDVAQLYEYLSAPGRLEDDKGLEKERIFKKLYPREAYNDAQMRQVIHFLREALEKYFIYKKSEGDEILAQIYLAQSYRERKLGKLQERAIRNLEEQGQNLTFLNDETLEKLYLIEYEKSIQLSDKLRAETLNYQEMSDLAEMAFIARKLKLACLMLSHQRIYKKNYELGMLEPMLTYLKSKPEVLKTPFINIYYHIYNLYRSPQEEGHFYEVKQNLIAYDSAFSESEKLDLYSIAINYCISRMNTGQQAFTREAFELYRRGLELKVLVEGQTLSHLNFRNIVAIGTTLKEFDWVSSFIQTYQEYLAPEYKENFVQFSWAKLYFDQGDYDRAQRLLTQFDIDDVLINLSAKSMLIRIYYEEGEVNTLEFLLDSMRTYINRKKMLAYHKMSFKELISASKRLIKLQRIDRKKIEILHNQISNSRTLPSHMKEWFLVQLDKLKR